jgi:hypothetical protein
MSSFLSSSQSPSSISLFAFERLQGTENFSEWKESFIAVLMHYGLRSHLLVDMPAGIARDPERTLAWKTDDERVLGDLILYISPSLRGIIRNVGTAKEAWDKLLSVYETRLASNILHLKKELYQCRMEDVTAKDAMQAHISRMRNLIDRLASVGTDITAEDAGVQLYLSLPDSYSHISAALSLKPVNELRFDVVASILLQEERRLQGLLDDEFKASQAEGRSLALLSVAGKAPQRFEPRGMLCPKCTYCGRPGHTEARCYRKHGYPEDGSDDDSTNGSARPTPTDAKAMVGFRYYSLLSSYDVNLLSYRPMTLTSFHRPMTLTFSPIVL